MALNLAHFAPLRSLRHLAIISKDGDTYCPVARLGETEACVFYSLKQLTYLEFEGGYSME
jgi:hypothetical protein